MSKTEMASHRDNDKVDISFIIPAKNEIKHIDTCLRAIVDASQPGVSIEIIVIDNGSTDSTVEVANKYTDLVYMRPELSISGMRNFAASVARGSYLAFIDADVTIGRNWIGAAMGQIAESNAGMVGASPGIPESSTWVTKTWHLLIANRKSVGQRKWLASMNMLVEKEVFHSVGGFDEQLLTCEDVDLGYKISRNFKIIHDSRIDAVHHGEATTLRELYLKERWRGTSNYEGAFRHGLTRSEIPSLLQPIVTILALAGIALGLLTGAFSIAAGSFLAFVAFPIAKTVHIANRASSWNSIPKLMVIWSVYSIARASSAVLELRRYLLRSSTSHYQR